MNTRLFIVIILLLLMGFCVQIQLIARFAKLETTIQNELKQTRTELRETQAATIRKQLEELFNPKGVNHGSV